MIDLSYNANISPKRIEITENIFRQTCNIVAGQIQYFQCIAEPLECKRRHKMQFAMPNIEFTDFCRTKCFFAQNGNRIAVQKCLIDCVEILK